MMELKCKQFETTGQFCDSCKEVAHVERMAPIHCHPSNREWVAKGEPDSDCRYLDTRCPHCHSYDVSRYEMDESFEHHCKRCGDVWLRFMDDGERLFLSEHDDVEAA